MPTRVLVAYILIAISFMIAGWLAMAYVRYRRRDREIRRIGSRGRSTAGRRKH